jgi:hypothetical protein
MSKFFLSLFIIAACCIFSFKSASAQDNSRIQVSLITCTPGEELYSIFGHSALRIIDSNNVTDFIFNYGTFNFADDGFYLKFIRGKLLYYLSVERTDEFIFSYMNEGRGITEQVLQLSPIEKENIKNTILENLKPENKFYQYDFFLDNCTTRLRDILIKMKSPSPLLPAVMPEKTTYRDAIHLYLDKGGQHWSKLGIDILLGKRTDKIMTASEQAFLPDNLMMSIDSCKNQPLVKQKNTILKASEFSNQNNLFTPFFCFGFFVGLISLLSLLKNKFGQIFMLYFDRIFFFILGALGVMLVLMWVASDHSMTKDNMNLIWANPFHLFFAMFIRSNSKWKKWYCLFTGISVLMLLVFWNMMPQQLNYSLIPIFILIVYRATIRYIHP